MTTGESKMSSLGIVSYSKRSIAALIILLTMWVFMGGGEYLYIVYDSGVVPSVYAMAMIAVLAIGYWLNDECGNGMPLGKETIAWYFVYCLFGGIAIAMFGANAYSIENFGRRISAFMFVLALALFLRSPYVRKYVVVGAELGGGGLATSVILGFLSIEFISPFGCRSGGFLVNPNGAAYCLVFAFLLSCLQLKRSFLAVFLQAFLLVGVLLTLSRSGILAAALAVFFMWRAGRCEGGKVALVGSVVAFLVLLASMVLPSFDNNGCVEFGLRDRIGGYVPENASHWIAGKGAAFVNEDASGNERLTLAKEAVETIKENWLWGAGVNPTHGERSHNQLLALMSEHGLFGGMLFLCFWYCAARSGVPRGVLWVALFLCMFDHSLFIPRFYLIALVCMFSPSSADISPIRLWREMASKIKGQS